MWVNTIRQAEGGAQVPLHLRNFFDDWQQLSIHSFLVFLSLLCQLVLLHNKEEKTNQLWSLRNVRLTEARQNTELSLLLSLCQRSLPPGDEVSLASSS